MKMRRARGPFLPGGGPCALLLCLLLAALFVPSAALAATEGFDTDPGSPINDYNQGANPAVYGGFSYSNLTGARALGAKLYWSGLGSGASGPASTPHLEMDYSSTGTGREVNIKRSSGGTFSFVSIMLSNWTNNSGGATAVQVLFQGYLSGTKVQESATVDVGEAGHAWATFTPATPWTGIDELRIVSLNNKVLDPFLDDFTYDLSTASTSAASSITWTGATLNGVVNPKGSSATVSFEYGTSTAYGSTAAAAQSPVSASADTPVSAAVTGLTCGTTYHYRVKSANGVVTLYGADATVTPPCNTTPSFVGATTTLTVAKNASATDIKGLLHASDADSGQTLTWTQAAAPNNGGALVFSGATASSGGTDITPGGTITYAPASGFAGTETFTVQVSDGTASATRTITVSVKSPQTISFANPGAQNFGTTPTLSATSSSGLTPTFTSATTGVCTVTAGGALTFVSAGPCTINADQAGDASYLAAPQAGQTFQVNAVAPGAPTIGVATAGSGQASVAFTAPASTGGSAITGYTATSSPGGFTGTNAASPITVAGLTNGVAYTFTVTATNSAGTGAASAASGSATPKASQTISFANPGSKAYGTSPTLSATASSTLSVSFTSATVGVCTVTAGGALTFVNTGTCTINADQAGNGAYLAAPQVSQSFTVTGPTITVSPATLPTAPSGSAYSQTITASGGTAPYTYAVTAGTLPTGLSLSVGGALSGTSTQDGTHNITITATDSHASHFTGSRAYALVVAPLPPAAGAVSVTVAWGSTANAIALNLTGGAATSVAVASQASHGTATAAGTNITYTPAAGYSGADSFTYTATNAGGTSAPATVSITVTPSAPVAGAMTVSVLADSTANPITPNLSGGSATSLAITTAPAHGTATVSGTSLRYTPTAGYTGADSFAYTATNAGGTSAPATVNITVQARTNPSQNAAVRGVITTQTDTSQRFAKAQITNFQGHLETLHSRVTTPGGGLSPSVSPGQFPGQGSGQSPGGALAARMVGARASCAPGDNASPGCRSHDPGGAKSAQNAGSASGSGEGDWDFSSLLLKAARSLYASKGGLPWSTLNVDSSFKDTLGTGLSVWTAGTLTVGGANDGNSRFTTSGVSMGSDIRIDEQLTVGLGVGFGRERQTIGGDGSKTTGGSYGLMLYGSYQPLGGFYLDGFLGYNRLSFDMKRYDTVALAFAESSRTGYQLLGSVSGGYEFKTPVALLSPYGRLDVARTELDRSTESGAGASNLVYFSQTTTSTRAALGLRGAVEAEFTNLWLKPFVRVEYQRDLSEGGTAVMAYADQLSTGSTYQFDLGTVDRNSMVLGGGLDMLFYKSWQLGMEYRYSRGSTTHMQTFGAILRKYLTF